MKLRMPKGLPLTCGLFVVGSMVFFAGNAHARNFPRPAPPGHSAGIPEIGKYQMSVSPGNRVVPYGGALVAAGAPAGAMVPNGFKSAGRVGGASLAPTLESGTGNSVLVVKVGEEKYLLRFKDHSEVEKYVAELQGRLSGTGMELRRKSIAKDKDAALSKPGP